MTTYSAGEKEQTSNRERETECQSNNRLLCETNNIALRAATFNFFTMSQPHAHNSSPLSPCLPTPRGRIPETSSSAIPAGAHGARESMNPRSTRTRIRTLHHSSGHSPASTFTITIQCHQGFSTIRNQCRRIPISNFLRPSTNWKSGL